MKGSVAEIPFRGSVVRTASINSLLIVNVSESPKIEYFA